MDYLFFDVECANCFEGTGKLCEFGYVLTDEKFNIIQKESILINPNTRFDPYVIKKMLNYTESEYKQNPTFNFFYDKIIGLITAKDRLIIGHTVGGDAKYVGADCMRYKLTPPDFDHIDIVEIYKGINEQKDATSLVKMSEIFGLEVPEEVHSALVDAHLTMLCTKALTESTGKSLPALVKEYPRALGRLENYREEYLRRKLYKQYLKDCKKKGIAEMTSEQKSTLNDYRRFISANKQAQKSVFKGKRVCISYNYECFNYAETLKIVKLLAERGAKCVGRATKCDIFVRYDIKYPDGLVYCQRLEQALATEKKGKKITYFGFNEFLNRLGLNEKSLKELPKVDAEKLIEKRKAENASKNVGETVAKTADKPDKK